MPFILQGRHSRGWCSAHTVPGPMHVVPVKLMNLMALRIVLKPKSLFIASCMCVKEPFIISCSCWLGSGPACSSDDVSDCKGLPLSWGFGSVCAFGWGALAGKGLLPFSSQFLIAACDVTVWSWAAVCRPFQEH